ncbi:MAG: glycyl radical protein [Bacteroidales bacterium]|nr:glycyl radical protein [Bacteroidales bacterium]
MNQRIYKLRQDSLNAINTLSEERALIITRFYASGIKESVSTPVMRAMAFRSFFEEKSLCILPGELIIGERGPQPKATPTFPEICVHSIQDLDILNKREKVSFVVSEQTRKAFDESIIPYWSGKTHRDRLMNQMDENWKNAYGAGIFTEFQEQRAPGHTVLGDIIYHKGMLDIIADIESELSKLNFYQDSEAYEKSEELKAMKITAEALIMYAERNAVLLDEMAIHENDDDRKKELLKIAAICRWVPAHAPRTMHEAIQYYWFVHLGVISELNPWDSFNPGRLDQHLLPFYNGDLASGRLTKESALELLQAFWIKFNNHPAPPKIGVTAEESNTYTDFSLINLGGLKPDGSDAVNELSFLILDVIEEMRLLQPSSMIQVSRKNPDNFIHRALKIIKTGYGQPSIFNTDGIIQQLTRLGKQIQDARKGGASGCVESGAFGTESYVLTGYFNLPKVLEITLYNGIDPLSGIKIGLETGNPYLFKSMDEVMAAFKLQLQFFIDIKIKGNNIIEKLFSHHLPVPFLSLLIDDCIQKGRDYNSGGARYNTLYIQGVGLGSITDSLAAIRYHVFETARYTFTDILNALKVNFKAYEEMRNELIYYSPKWGNDNDEADQFAVQVFEAFYEAVDNRPSPKGAKHRINMLPTTCHIYFGKKTSALPDGRLAGTPLSEGISPVQGSDTQGPTAVLKSAAKIDQLRTGGTLLNQKFSPSFFEKEDGIKAITALVRTYFRMDGHHIQFNVVNVDTLRDAQKHPEKYRDLIVRVAGYSDYFNDLGKDLQDEIIHRTEHQNIANN